MNFMMGALNGLWNISSAHTEFIQILLVFFIVCLFCHCANQTFSVKTEIVDIFGS